MGASLHSAVTGFAPSLTGRGSSTPPRPDPYTPDNKGLPLHSRCRTELQLSHAAAAAAEGGSPVWGAFAAAIELDGDGKAPEWIQLFPKGPKLETVNYDSREWTLSDPAAVAAASMQDGLDLPVDWEHAQAVKAPKGKRVKTAGWIKQIAVRDGVLRGRVEWTDEGRASVESKQYKYFSPYFLAARASGEVWRIQHGGLVKTPAFAMPALASGKQGAEPMWKKVLEALGLPADATEEQAATAVAALKKERDEAKASAASAATPSLEKFVPRGDYDAAVARAEAAEGKLAEGRDAEIKRELDAAQAAGKITPATRPYYEAQCKTEGGLKAFKEFAAAAPEIAAPSGVSGAPPSGTAAGFASAEEGRIAKAFGRDAKFLDEHAPREGVS